MIHRYFFVFFALPLSFCIINPSSAQTIRFEYPYYLVDAFSPEGECWIGMGPHGRWPVQVLPQEWLVGVPPAIDVSGVTIPIDHWIELQFDGEIVDGWADDVLLVELDPVGEQSLVFLTDGIDQEYLLGLAAVPSVGAHGPTTVGFDINSLSLPFKPVAVRIVGVDLRGGSPGFDLANIRARISSACGDKAANPKPLNISKNVPVDEILSWSGGCSANKSAVYFSDSISEVMNEDSLECEIAHIQDTNSYDPGLLELGKTYYWRVDEINNDDLNSVRTGDIWKFTVEDYLVVEDFETYLRNDIYEKWEKVGYSYISVSELSNIVHRCRQSMSLNYYYDNAFYSEARYRFESPQDWASIGAEVLQLHFHGQAENDFGAQMYIAISDGDVNSIVPYYGDPNDILKEVWQAWRIELEDFVDIDLSRIESLSIGFANRTPVQLHNGIGTVFFDDIRIYPSMCIQENKPLADLDNDCIVDFKEFDELISNWLDSGYKVYPVTEPNEPVAWYKFDGNLNDSVGNAHGRFIGSPIYASGVYGQAIGFDGLGNSVDITNVSGLFANVRTGITISFWQFGTESNHRVDTICCSNFVYGIYNPTIAVNLGCWRSPGKYNWDCGSRWSFDSRLSGHHRYENEWSGRWNHWAFTKDSHTGKMEIYLNGALYNSRIGAPSLIAGVISFEIGSGWYGGYDGLLDDFRIYDYPLTGPEIAFAATNGTGIFDQDLMSPADFNADRKIDFKDFAILANYWLEKRLFP